MPELEPRIQYQHTESLKVQLVRILLAMGNVQETSSWTVSVESPRNFKTSVQGREEMGDGNGSVSINDSSRDNLPVGRLPSRSSLNTRGSLPHEAGRPSSFQAAEEAPVLAQMP